MNRRTLAERLREIGVEEAQTEADIILRECFGLNRQSIIQGSAELPDESFTELLRRRAEGEPLMYILGYTYFYRERYTVNPSVLIPRQDTELLVEYAVGHIPEGENILDLFTGSGCVGISALKNSSASFATLVDFSDGALSVAEENSVQNEVYSRVELIKCDLSRDLPKGRYFAILANPPYVSAASYGELDAGIYFEPKMAFLGGESGLDFYEILIPKLHSILKAGGFIAFEIGFDQGEALRSLGHKNGYNVEILKDFSGLDRVAVLKPVFG